MSLHAYTPLLHAVKTSQPHVSAIKQPQSYNISTASTKSLTNFNLTPPLPPRRGASAACSASPPLLFVSGVAALAAPISLEYERTKFLKKIVQMRGYLQKIL